MLPTGSRTGCVVGWSVSLLTLCHVVCRQAIMRHHQHPITTIIMFTSSLLSAYPSPTHLSTPHLHHVTFRPQCWLHSTRVPGSRDCTRCSGCCRHQPRKELTPRAVISQRLQTVVEANGVLKVYWHQVYFPLAQDTFISRIGLITLRYIYGHTYDHHLPLFLCMSCL